MTYRVRNVNDAVLAALVKAHNDERRAGISTEVHYGVSGATVTGDPRDPVQADLQAAAANASDLATLLTLSNELAIVYAQHGADTHVHDGADTTNVVAAAVATDLATAQTLLNELKADYNAHRSEAGVHPNNDAGNAVAAADATDQATAETLANEIKTDLNAHISAALVGQGVELIAP
jgi:hypothetical protein